jgi:tRNA(adenine34) deaminase
MDNNETFMSEAIQEAKRAKEAGDLPFGAVITSNGKIVGRAGCKNNTTGDVTDHAELLALREACRTLGKNELKECTIYCTNEPCPMCASALFQAKIAHVVVGLIREDLQDLLRPRNIRMKNLAQDSGFNVNIEMGVLKDQILELFADIKSK